MTSSSSDVVWEDPPRTSVGREGFKAFWAALQANPGRWARYPGRGAVQGAIKNHPGFEGVSRLIDGEVVGFVRYIGNRDQP